MGVRGSRWPRGIRFRLGRRALPGWNADGEQLAGRVPLAEPEARRFRGDVSGGLVPAEQLRPLRHDRQRLGVDDRFLYASPRGRGGETVLCPAQPSGDEQRGELRGRRDDPAAGDQRRLLPLRAELLPPLPTRRSARRGARHLYRPHRLPLRRAGGRLTARDAAAAVFSSMRARTADSLAGVSYTARVTRRKVAGMEVTFSAVLVFLLTKRSSSSAFSSSSRPSAAAASNAFIVGP